MDKPDVNTYCPATGKKLRLKDLIPVKFTKVRLSPQSCSKLAAKGRPDALLSAATAWSCTPFQSKAVVDTRRGVAGFSTAFNCKRLLPQTLGRKVAPADTGGFCHR